MTLASEEIKYGRVKLGDVTVSQHATGVLKLRVIRYGYGSRGGAQSVRDVWGCLREVEEGETQEQAVEALMDEGLKFAASVL